MGIEEVTVIIGKIAAGFEENCAKTLQEKQGVVLASILEQLKAGQDGKGEALEPNYDNDPFFKEEGFWHNRGADYKAWKRTIPVPNFMPELALPMRPDHIPNLFIDGTFYGDINAKSLSDGLEIDPGTGHGPDIVSKWGQQILTLGPIAVAHFNEAHMLPSIDRFFQDCGYR